MNRLERYVTAITCYAGEVWNSRKPASFSSMSIAAVEYINSNTGRGALTARQRENIQEALRLGVLVNDYWDERFLAHDEYRQRRRTLGRNGLISDYRNYYKDISSIEKGRPDPRISATEKVFEYREKLNAVALGGIFAMAELGRYGDFIGENKHLKPEAESWFKDLWKIVMAFQVIDDQMGWVGDTRHNRPTFYTALATGSGLSRKETNSILNQKWKEYLAGVGSEEKSVEMEPLVIAVGMMGMVLPRAYEVLRKMPGGNKYMKGRERKEG